MGCSSLSATHCLKLRVSCLTVTTMATMMQLVCGASLITKKNEKERGEKSIATANSVVVRWRGGGWLYLCLRITTYANNQIVLTWINPTHFLSCCSLVD